MKFWDNAHELSTLAENQMKALMPMMGNCETLAGELIRCATRIYHDYYNNGSCNNTTGAWNMLSSIGSGYVEKQFPNPNGNSSEYSRFVDALYEVKPYMNCDAPRANFKDARINEAFDSIVAVITLAVANEMISGELTPNSVDLFDFQDPDEYEDEEEDEEWM